MALFTNSFLLFPFFRLVSVGLLILSLFVISSSLNKNGHLLI